MGSLNKCLKKKDKKIVTYYLRNEGVAKQIYFIIKQTKNKIKKFQRGFPHYDMYIKSVYGLCWNIMIGISDFNVTILIKRGGGVLLTAKVA